MATLLTQTYNLNLIPGQNIVVVNAAAYDNSPRLIRFNMFNGAVAADVSGWSARVEGTRQGTKEGFSTVCTVASPVVSFAITNAMTASSGKHQAAVVFYQGEERVASATFILNVAPAVLDESTPATEEDATIYQQWLTANTSQIQANANDIAVLKGRMDEFASLPPGSTEGNAELVDIRVGADGTTYPTAGDAVRNQVTDLKSALDFIYNDGFIPSVSDIEQGTFDRNGNTTENANRIRVKGFVHVYPGTVIRFTPGVNAAKLLLGYFNTNKQYQSDSEWYYATEITITEEGYLIFVFKKNPEAAITPAEYDATLSVFSPISDDLDRTKAALERIDRKTNDVAVPEVRNGSVGNAGNLTAITSKYVIPIKSRYKTMHVEYIGDRESITDYAFFYCFYHGAVDGMTSSAAYVSSSISKRQVNQNANTLIQIPYEDVVFSDYAGYEHFAVGLWVKNGNEWLPLRSSTDQYCLRITFSDNSGADDMRKITQQNTLKETLNARHIEEDAGTALTLAHFSDLHADTGALSRIMEDIAQMGTAVDEIICTGDMVAGTATQISEWWPVDVLTVIGNHDTASYSAETGYDWAALSMADRDAYYIAPFISNWGDVVHTPGTSYYYKDYTPQKVRLIVLDAQLYITNGSEATTQTAWLANLLSDAIYSNLDVVIAIHAPYRNAPVVPCTFSRYGRETMANLQDSFTPDAVVSAVTTAIGNGLNFVGYVVGHNHQDYIYKATETQLGFCVTCANVASRAQWRGSDQNRDALSDAYNLVTIDTTNKLVKIVRGGGADINNHMRTRKAICFNYSTGEKVGEVE